MPISSYQAANAFLKMLALAHLRRLEIKTNAWCNYIFLEWGGWGGWGGVGGGREARDIPDTLNSGSIARVKHDQAQRFSFYSSVREGGSVMKQHQVAGGEPLFRCCCSSLSVCAVSPTNGIISSEFKPLLPLPLQPFLLPALLFTSISLSPSPLPSLSLCSQRQDLKQHG